VSDPRQRISQVLAHYGVTVQGDLTDDILREIDQMRGLRCADQDCVRRRRHSLLGPHLWRHAASAPFTRSVSGWLCFTCGRREHNRIHQVPGSGDAP
jgi:hypothetical protein